MLASNRMTDLIQKLVEAHDMVLFDSPPLIPVTDAALLAPKIDGILLVIKYGATHKDAARHALEILERVGAPPIGALLNDVEVVRRLGYYRYYYNYYYYYYHEDEKKKEKAKS